MSDPEKPANLPLSVLPHSGKIDQLKREADLSPPPTKTLADQSIIDRALDRTKSPRQRAIEEKVIDVLRRIFDPEIPVNIYDLGLIYQIGVSDSDGSVHVKMTLTAPGCPVAGSLPPEVQQKIETISDVPRATVELVWDPPWTKDRMSEEARLELGL